MALVLIQGGGSLRDPMGGNLHNANGPLGSGSVRCGLYNLYSVRVVLCYMISESKSYRGVERQARAVRKRAGEEFNEKEGPEGVRMECLMRRKQDSKTDRMVLVIVE